MYIVPAIEYPGREGSVPISIFSHNNQRKFIHVSQDYQETIERVAKSFRIENPKSLLLQTSCLTACRGENVIIDSSAYTYLWCFLSDIEVVITNDFDTEDDSQAVRGRLVVDKPAIRSPSPRGREAGPSHDNSRRAQGPYLSPPSTSEISVLLQDMVKNSDPLFHWDGVGPQKEEKPTTLVEENSPFTSPRKKFKAAPSQKQDTKIKQEEPQETNISARSKQGAQSSVSVIRKDSRSVQIDDDSRFDVLICGPEDQSAQFKLRGKNSVKKVLTAACENFGLDVARAHLVLCMEVEVDGEMQTHEFVCTPDDTMASCAINAGSKLFVKVDPISN